MFSITKAAFVAVISLPFIGVAPASAQVWHNGETASWKVAVNNLAFNASVKVPSDPKHTWTLGLIPELSPLQVSLAAEGNGRIFVSTSAVGIERVYATTYAKALQTPGESAKDEIEMFGANGKKTKYTVKSKKKLAGNQTVVKATYPIDKFGTKGTTTKYCAMHPSLTNKDDGKKAYYALCVTDEVYPTPSKPLTTAQLKTMTDSIRVAPAKR